MRRKAYRVSLRQPGYRNINRYDIQVPAFLCEQSGKLDRQSARKFDFPTGSATKPLWDVRENIMFKVSSSVARKTTNTFRLLDYYHNFFKVVPATSHEQKMRAYQLRYQVYCLENQFEDPDAFPSYMEYDEYDERSIHSLLIDRDTHAAAGTVRIILPRQDAPEQSFPIQNVCSHPLLSDCRFLSLETAGEISRFAISREYRKFFARSLSNRTVAGQVSPWQDVDSSLLLSNIVIGLIKAATQSSIESGLTDLFALMEPSLLRLMSRFGIYFTPIGPLVEFHGMRQPCHIEIATLLQRVRRERFDVWEVLTDEGRLLTTLRRSPLYACS